MKTCRRTGLRIIAALAMTLVTRAEAPQQVTLPPELIDALDLAPPALRYVPREACCGMELGALYEIPGRSTDRYPLFVTGSHIGIQIPPLVQQPVSPGATPSTPSLRLVATGAAGGDAFRIEILAGAATAGRFIASDGLVLEAVSDRAPSSTPDAQTIVTGLEGFSAEFSKDPPPAGTMYRVAPARQQERLKPIRYVLRAADGLGSTRRLRSDRDPEYLNFVKQWSIWTRLERWDLREFGETFTNLTRKNLESAKQPWTRDIEQRVRALVPGRWGDVQTVLTTADVLAAGPLVNAPRR